MVFSLTKIKNMYIVYKIAFCRRDKKHDLVTGKSTFCIVELAFACLILLTIAHGRAGGGLVKGCAHQHTSHPLSVVFVLEPRDPRMDWCAHLRHTNLCQNIASRSPTVTNNFYLRQNPNITGIIRSINTITNLTLKHFHIHLNGMNWRAPPTSY